MKNNLCAALLLIAGQSFGQGQNCVYLASDVYPGSYGSQPAALTVYNGAMYFCATGNAQGPELWKYENGVSSMVADINPGFAGSMPNLFTVLGPYLYFSATNGVNGIELFRYDGTTVTMVADINPGVGASFVNKLTVVGSELYFFANDGVNGMEPWKFDGTTATMVADIFPGSNGSNPLDLEAYGGDVFFVAYNPSYGQELWKYDGVSATVFDLYPGTQGSDVNELTSIGTKLCFRATDGVLGYELWAYDGVSVTNLDANPGAGDFTPWELTAMGSQLFCRGVSPTAGYELHKYDGTAVTLVYDIRPGTPNSSPNNLTVVNGTHLYFAANNGVVGNELWHYDGTTCVLAADIRTGSSGSMPVFFLERMASVGDDVFMVAASATSGNEVWRYDGTTCTLGKDIIAGTGTPSPTALFGYGSIMYFIADDGVAGGELWAWNPDAELEDSISVTTCAAYTSPAGDVYTAEGNYNFVDTVPSITCPGCDSLITVDLTITTQPSSSITVVTCNDYTSPSGTYYNVEGTYSITDIIPSVACPGVDSIINIDLTILDDISTAVVVFSGVLVAQQAGATYQWLDCDNGYAPVPGATDQDFLPAVDGTYAVHISASGCSDTSSCYFVDVDNGGSGIGENQSDISIYPNPGDDLIYVHQLNGVPMQLQMVNGLGEVVVELQTSDKITPIDIAELANGVYIIHIRTSEAYLTRKFIKL